MSKKDVKKIDLSKAKDDPPRAKEDHSDELKNLKSELEKLKEEVQALGDRISAAPSRAPGEGPATSIITPEEVAHINEHISASSRYYEELKAKIEELETQRVEGEAPGRPAESFTEEIERKYGELKGQVEEILLNMAEPAGPQPVSLEAIEQKINEVVSDLVVTRVTSLEERVAKTVGSELAKIPELMASMEQLKAREEEHRQSLTHLSQKLEEMKPQAAPGIDPAKQVEQTAKLLNYIEEKLGPLPTATTTETFITRQMEAAKKSELSFNINSLLDVLIGYKAPVLQIRKDSAPLVKVEGELIPVGNSVLSEEDCARLILPLLSPEQLRALAYKDDTSFSLTYEGARFKFLVFVQRKSIGATIKMLPKGIPSFATLSMPDDLKDLFKHKNGLVLLAGLHGSGRSSLGAAIIDYFNNTRKLHIITLENPIEFYHPNDKLCLITQREWGTDFIAFGPAMRQSLYQDPDVIFIGELNDAETLMSALSAADSGHLVISTIISPDAINTVEKIIDTFPGEGRKHANKLLARVLRLIITVRMLDSQAHGKVPLTEVLVNTPLIAGLIEENRLSEIYGFMESGTSKGMRSFSQSLSRLAEANQISEEEHQKFQALMELSPARV